MPTIPIKEITNVTSQLVEASKLEAAPKNCSGPLVVAAAAEVEKRVAAVVVLPARTTEGDPAASVVLEKPTIGSVTVVLSDEITMVL
jgi:hypothetical protein